jgi:uncharacterized SAM-binding protein YcdF (DUF218 family)
MEILRGLDPLSEPVGLLWLLQLGTAIALAWRRQWRCAGILAALLLVFSLVGSTSIARRLVAALERPYARASQQDLPSGDVVIMLGGSHRTSQNDVFGFELTNASDRALTALELMRQQKGQALVVGGSTIRTGGQDRHTSVLLHNWFSAWGLPVKPVFFLANANNTREEALRVQSLAKEHGWKRLLLVTSAYHMRRAEAVFTNVGLNVVPVGCDFQAYGVIEEDRSWSPIPQMKYLHLWSYYLHEQWGWLFYRCRGWVS